MKTGLIVLLRKHISQDAMEDYLISFTGVFRDGTKLRIITRISILFLVNPYTNVDELISFLNSLQTTGHLKK